jgi:hypothetical protein
MRKIPRLIVGMGINRFELREHNVKTHIKPFVVDSDCYSFQLAQDSTTSFTPMIQVQFVELRNTMPNCLLVLELKFYTFVE